MGKTFSHDENVRLAIQAIKSNPGETALRLFCGNNLQTLPNTDIRNRRRIGRLWDSIRPELLSRGVYVEGNGRGQRYFYDWHHGEPVHTPKAFQILEDSVDDHFVKAPYAFTPPHAPNNANQHYPLTNPEREALVACVGEQFEQILQMLGIDTVNDHNSAGTAHRVAKMWVKELCNGRFGEEPAITVFPNASGLNQMVLSGPIRFVSMCSHHWQPIVGEAYVAYIPGQTVLGLSKLSRIVEFYARRPQIQEEMTHQVADHLDEILPDALGLGILLRSSHGCMTHRGVNDPHTQMTTSELRGVFLNNAAVRQEFFDLCRDSKRGD